NWLTGGRFAQGEAKRLISQLLDANAAKREHAAQDLVKLGAEAMHPLLEALQARDPNLPPLIKQVIARMGPPARRRHARSAKQKIRLYCLISWMPCMTRSGGMAANKPRMSCSKQ
ncbi:MAG: hypothetical protein MUO77_02655, partial [Anaerolineales bacterium]|nr:hypothetical protein [Anaerolineales bacterium]